MVPKAEQANCRDVLCTEQCLPPSPAPPFIPKAMKHLTFCTYSAAPFSRGADVIALSVVATCTKPTCDGCKIGWSERQWSMMSVPNLWVINNLHEDYTRVRPGFVACLYQNEVFIAVFQSRGRRPRPSSQPPCQITAWNTKGLELAKKPPVLQGPSHQQRLP